MEAWLQVSPFQTRVIYFNSNILLQLIEIGLYICLCCQDADWLYIYNYTLYTFKYVMFLIILYHESNNKTLKILVLYPSNPCEVFVRGTKLHVLNNYKIRDPEINLYWPGQVWCNYPVIIATYHHSLTLGFSVTIPILPQSAQSRLRLLASTCFCWNHKYSTWGGYRSNWSFHSAFIKAMLHNITTACKCIHRWMQFVHCMVCGSGNFCGNHWPHTVADKCNILQ